MILINISDIYIYFENVCMVGLYIKVYTGQPKVSQGIYLHLL